MDSLYLFIIFLFLLAAKFDDFLIEAKKAKDRGECRYAVYDVEFEHGGLTKNKLLFIMWYAPHAFLLYSSF